MGLIRCEASVSMSELWHRQKKWQINLYKQQRLAVGKRRDQTFYVYRCTQPLTDQSLRNASCERPVPSSIPSYLVLPLPNSSTFSQSTIPTLNGLNANGIKYSVSSNYSQHENKQEQLHKLWFLIADERSPRLMPKRPMLQTIHSHFHPSYSLHNQCHSTKC